MDTLVLWVTFWTWQHKIVQIVLYLLIFVVKLKECVIVLVGVCGGRRSLADVQAMYEPGRKCDVKTRQAISNWISVLLQIIALQCILMEEATIKTDTCYSDPVISFNTMISLDKRVATWAMPKQYTPITSAKAFDCVSLYLYECRSMYTPTGGRSLALFTSLGTRCVAFFLSRTNVCR